MSTKNILLLCVSATLCATSHAQVEIVVGAPATAEISEPFSVDFDSKGVLHGVEFSKSNRIFRLVDGQVEFIAGQQHATMKEAIPADLGDGHNPLKAIFNGMHDIQITSDDRAIIGDSFNHSVRLLDLEIGAVSTIAGTGQKGFSGDGGPARKARFNITMTAGLSPNEQSVFVADIGNHRTREIDLATGIVRTVAGNGKKGLPTDGAPALETPMGDTRAACQDAEGTLYVLLRGGNALVAVRDGKVRTVVNTAGKKGATGDGGPGRKATMRGPKYVAMDHQGRVLIADAENHTIRRYDPKSKNIELIAGTPGERSDTLGDTLLKTGLARPHGVRIGPDGMIYVCDTYNNRVLRAPYR